MVARTSDLSAISTSSDGDKRMGSGLLIEGLRGEIFAVRPCDGPSFGVDANPGEIFRIAEWPCMSTATRFWLLDRYMYWSERDHPVAHFHAIQAEQLGGGVKVAGELGCSQQHWTRCHTLRAGLPPWDRSS